MTTDDILINIMELVILDMDKTKTQQMIVNTVSLVSPIILKPKAWKQKIHSIIALIEDDESIIEFIDNTYIIQHDAIAIYIHNNLVTTFKYIHNPLKYKFLTDNQPIHRFSQSTNLVRRLITNTYRIISLVWNY